MENLGGMFNVFGNPGGQPKRGAPKSQPPPSAPKQQVPPQGNPKYMPPPGQMPPQRVQQAPPPPMAAAKAKKQQMRTPPMPPPPIVMPNLESTPEIKVSKQDLVNMVAERTCIKKKDVKETLDALYEVIVESVVEGKKVVITGVGSFERKYRPPRTGRNPGTGEVLQIPGNFGPAFSVSAKFKNLVKQAYEAEAPAVTPAAAPVPPPAAAGKRRTR